MPFSYTSSLTKKELKEIADKIYKKSELENLKFVDTVFRLFDEILITQPP